MAKYVFKEGTVLIDGNDLSDHVRNVDMPMSKDQVEDTGLNGNGLHTYLPGLASERFTITFASDFDSGSVNDVLYEKYRNDDIFEVSVNPIAGATSATNPRFSALCQLYDYDPVNAAVGALSEMQVNFIAIEAIVPTYT